MKALVTKILPDDILAPLLAVAEVDQWEGAGAMPRGLLEEMIGPCQGVLSMLTDPIDSSLLEGAPQLTVVSQMAVGVDNIDIDACRRRGIVVGHTPDVLTETVADTAFALAAAVVRRIDEGARRVRDGEWGPWEPWEFLGGDLHGQTLGIVGMGRIGQAIARRALGFDMEVLYAAPTEKAVSATRVGFEELLERSGVVVIAAPLNDETRGMIGAAQLRAMGPETFLVNVARGPLVDTGALVEALAGGVIAGAALDVTDPEPLPAGHPLLAFPNCLVVPHIGSASVRTRRAMASLAVGNLVAGLTGQALPARYA